MAALSLVWAGQSPISSKRHLSARPAATTMTLTTERLCTAGVPLRAEITPIEPDLVHTSEGSRQTLLGLVPGGCSPSLAGGGTADMTTTNPAPLHPPRTISDL